MKYEVVVHYVARVTVEVEAESQDQAETRGIAKADGLILEHAVAEDTEITELD